MIAVAKLGSRMSRHVTLYAFGSGITLALALVSIAIVTRYLDPGEFGTLAIYLLYASLLTVLFNLGSLQGSFAVTFGAGAEDDGADDDDDATRLDRRRALGSALSLTITVAAVGTALLVALAPAIATVLSGDAGDAPFARLAAISGALGAMWRLVSNIPRLERRSGTFLAVTALRPLIVLGFTVPLVASQGARGVLVALAAGTAAALVLGLLAIRRSFRPAFAGDDVKAIAHFGKRWVPLIITFWIIQNADLFVLSRFVADEDVGVYRVAARIGAVMSYFVGAVGMAWTPLRRASIFRAAERQHGRQLGAHFCLYFMLASSALLLMLAVGADVIVGIAGPSFAGAAPLIPLAGAGFVAHGAYIVLNRTARYPGRRKDFLRLAIVACVVFIVLAIVLSPPLGGYGAALAVILGFSVAIAIMLLRSQRSASPLPLSFRRIGGAMALAVLCYLGADALARLTDVPLLKGTALVAYPVLVVALGVVPRGQVTILRAIAAGALGRRGTSIGVLRGRVESLPDTDHAILELALRHRLTSAEIAARTGVGESELQARLVRALRHLAAVPDEPSEHDARIGAHLLRRGPVAERDLRSGQMAKEGLDPESLDAVESTFDSLRRNRRVWRRVSAG